jgi:Fe-S oxidoreductase
VSKFYPIFKKFEFLGRKVILANEFVKIDENYNKINVQNQIEKNITVVYFKGCVNEKVNPKVKNAAETILKKAGVKILPINFECCGMPFLSAGNAEQFKKQAISNLSKINDDFDYFLTEIHLLSKK